nr:PKD domain-containing protein [bacterium]
MFRTVWVWPALLGLLLLGACKGGGTTVFPGGNGGFDLRITTDKTSGPAPLTVSFFVTPSGGTAPYTYAWDFNDDGVIDSNAPSGQFTYQLDSIARIAVTDSAGQIMTASQTITITDVPPPLPGNPLVVKFNATPQTGRVPFDVQFSPVVVGGRGPYSFAWDFEGDGIYDEFTQNPLHRYEEVGQRIDADHYAYFPVLKVTDSRGITETNLQDIDAVAGPDFLYEITTLTPEQTYFAVAFANPESGQAPLTVEFTANVGGGSGNIRYSWDFGDNQTSSPSSTSSTTHTYQSAGTYIARVTALDQDSGLTAVSAPITINATQAQPFSLDVEADITSGQVPFVVNFSANPVNGQEPIIYEWTVFDNDINNPNPTPANPPSLSPRAVVTPDETQRKNPAIHFGNTSDSAGAHQYRVRLAATDALGTTRVSDFIIITAQPHPQPAPGGDGAYTANRPLVVDRTIFPVQHLDPSLTANACWESDAVDPTNPANPAAFRFPQEWSPRANAAVCTHPSGVT